MGKMRRESTPKREVWDNLCIKALLIVGLVILLLACTQPEPTSTPTPAADLQATIEALRAEPTPMVRRNCYPYAHCYTYQHSYTDSYAYCNSNIRLATVGRTPCGLGN